MPAVSIAPSDLAPFADIPLAKAQAMISDALAMAALLAPCITTTEFAYADAAKAILRGAILRWHEAGQGGIASQAALGFSQSYDNRTQRRSMFWPSEIEQLQSMCKSDGVDDGAWSYDTISTSTVMHADICSLNFGADYCSCGAVLTGSLPLWS